MVRKVSTSTMRDGSFPFGNGTGKPTLVRGHLPLKFQWITHTKRLRAKCSVATLEGTYLFAQNGVEIKGNDQSPFAIAGYDVFDGNGEVKGVASGNFNGETFRNDSGSGTYSVKANCTGTFTFTNGTRYDMFIAPDGSMFTFVRTNPKFVSSGFELRGTAKRVGE